MSIVAVDTITDASGGNTASINGIPLRQGVIDPENRIINGAFDFWQRGTSFTTNTYGADRWLQNEVGGTVTMSRQSHTVGDKFGSNTPQFYLRQTVSGQSAAVQLGLVAQRVESVRSYAGETITVLGWARRSSGSGNMALEVVQGFGTGGSPSATVTAINPTTITLTADWEPFAAVLTVPSIAGKTLGTNNNDNFALVFWTSAGSDYNARTNSLGIQTIGVDLWGIHIKLGVHTADATALYKQPELGPELARCQRYYETGSVWGVSYASSAAAIQRCQCTFQAVKRAQPTNTVTVVAGSLTSPFISDTRTNMAWIGFNSAGASLDGLFSYTSDAEL